MKSKFECDIPSLKNVYRIGGQGHSDDTYQETAPWAIRCLPESESFEDTIRIAVGAGSDADTKAAICESTVRAYYEMPEELIEQACEYLPGDMLRVINHFYGHVGGGTNPQCRATLRVSNNDTATHRVKVGGQPFRLMLNF